MIAKRKQARRKTMTRGLRAITRQSGRFTLRMEDLEARRVLAHFDGHLPDDFESNDTIQTATVLGSPTSLTLPGDFGGRDLAISDVIPETVDVIVMVDESGSMTIQDRNFLASLIPQLNAELISNGIEANQFGLVGFSANITGPNQARSIQVGGNLFGTATDFAAATGGLSNSGGSIEDGYAAINFALDSYPFRDEAGKLFVVVSDEDRDEGNPASPLTQLALQSNLLDPNEVALHGILDVTINSGAGIAINNSGVVYTANGLGGFLTSPGGSITSAAGNTNNPAEPNENYVQPIFATDGLVGNLNAVRVNIPTLNQSLRAAFIDGFLDSLPQADDDYYRYTAHHTGMLQVNALFDVTAGGDDNLDLEILAPDGSVIASSATTTSNEMIAIPVVSQEVYYIHVFGATNDDQNEYALEIENFAAPVPTAVRLDPTDDSGMMNNDLVTSNNTPRLIISADLNAYSAAGIPVDITTTPGADVRVDITPLSGGIDISNFIGATEFSLASTQFDTWEFTPQTLPDGIYTITARTTIVDGATPSNLGFSLASPPLQLTIDTTAPEWSQPTLLASSDTGMENGDSVTSIRSPAFSGVAEENAKVFLYATPIGTDPDLATANLVGQATATGFAVGEGLGRWEITSEPLADGAWDFFTVVVDAAGNSSVVAGSTPAEEGTPVTTVWIDTAVPNTPFMELLNDNGHSDSDNLTSNSALVLRVVGSDTVDGGVNPFPNDIKYRIYQRPGDGSGEVLLFDSFATFGGFVEFGQITLGTVALDDGVHNLKLEVEDRAGNISPDFLLEVEIDSELATEPTIDLLESSDTGMDPEDNVTKIIEPAFTGLAEADSIVRVYATNVDTGTTQLVGEGRSGSDLSDVAPPTLIINGEEVNGEVDDNIGVWEVTVEPLADATYDFVVETEDWAGNVGQSEPLRVVIDSNVPNTPFLDLLNDTGHGDYDKITNDNLLDFLMVGNDTVDGGDNPVPNDVKYRLYWRPGDSDGEVLVYDSFAALSDFTTAGQITETVSQTLNDPLGVPFPDGVHNFKLEIEDRAGNLSPDFLLEIEIDTVLAIPPTIDLLESSDSGMDAGDNVTNIIMPAFSGLAEADSIVRVYATNVATGTTQLVGEGLAGSDLSDVPPPELVINGTPVNGEEDDDIGVWEVTVEPLTDGVYDIVVESEDWAGNFDQSEPLRIEIDSLAPNLPFLDLVEASDSGRHNDDNVTNDSTPSLTMTSEDRTANPMLYEHLIAENFKFRIFDRLEETTEILLYDSFADLGDFTSLQFLETTTGLLADGIHNLKLEVEDRAGNISPDFLLDVLIDTAAPAAPTIMLDASSDTGVAGYPDTIADRITADDSPGFVGRAEANAIVRMTATEGLDDTDQGLTVAVPLDGDEAFPAGHWSHTGDFNLNDPGEFPFDGLRTVSVTAEDLAGNEGEAGTIEVFIDTQGPRIESVEIEGSPDFNLFASKPALEGPTPVIDALTISVSDLPDRVAQFLYDALQQEVAEHPGNYLVVGDNNGIIPIESVVVTQPTPTAGNPAEATITLNFFEPLPDDRITLTISDDIVDPVGNALDGETNGLEPQDPPTLPSGNGVPGGSFSVRFTVDSRAEVGVYAAGSVYVDTNGNEIHDPDSGDFTNRDITYTFGFTTDTLFAGNFYDSRVNDSATADGFDKLAGYGKVGDRFRWIIDTTNDGVVDLLVEEPLGFNGLPVAGNFDNNAANGDEVGLLTPTHWWFDTDHDFQLDTSFATNMVGYPIVGDFDGDGADDLGAFTQDFFSLDLSSIGGIDGQSDTLQSNDSATTATEFRFGFPGPRDRPVAADFDGDGIDDIGLWVPDRSGATPLEGAEWYFLISGDRSITERFVNFDDFADELTVDFTPEPFGNDLFMQFGDDFGVPIVGNFDPPIVVDTTPVDPTVTDIYDGRYHNSLEPTDVDESGLVTLGDAIAVISDLRTHGPRVLYNDSAVDWKVDVNADETSSISDALGVVARLRSNAGEAEGEAPAIAAAAVGKSSQASSEKTDTRTQLDQESFDNVDSALVALLAESATAASDETIESVTIEEPNTKSLDEVIADLSSD